MSEVTPIYLTSTGKRFHPFNPFETAFTLTTLGPRACDRGLSHENWSPPKRVLPERPRQKNWSPRNIRGRKIGPLGTVRGTAHGPPLLSMVPRPKSVSSALPGFVYQVGALSCSLGRYWLIARCPALRGCIFTLANIHHKTMHNPNLSTLNYLFLYIHHETNCDMNHPSYLWLTASAKYLELFNSSTSSFSLSL